MKSQAPSIMRRILVSLENETPKVKQIFYKAAVLDAFNRENTSENTTSGTIDDHIKFMANFFDELISNLDNEGEAVSHIRKIGQDHAKLSQTCSFNAEIWEHLGEIAMQTLSTIDVVQLIAYFRATYWLMYYTTSSPDGLHLKKIREGGKAWRALIACVTDELRCGFDGEARVFSRKSSSSEHLAEDDELQHRLRQIRLDFSSAVPL
ncbi:unnamed protein product [Anisakis simplex]|uniref:Globin-like protein 9 (inferred by orthology to a C. elegans protein) n=1 Tax=Anisakis simplex TaxID=6269 RepID=A0A0M3K317_ANISI|nr:unnamed protein product [Anisakis simplex]